MPRNPQKHTHTCQSSDSAADECEPCGEYDELWNLMLKEVQNNEYSFRELVSHLPTSMLKFLIQLPGCPASPFVVSELGSRKDKSAPDAIADKLNKLEHVKCVRCLSSAVSVRHIEDHTGQPWHEGPKENCGDCDEVRSLYRDVAAQADDKDLAERLLLTVNKLCEEREAQAVHMSKIKHTAILRESAAEAILDKLPASELTAVLMQDHDPALVAHLHEDMRPATSAKINRFSSEMLNKVLRRKSEKEAK